MRSVWWSVGRSCCSDLRHGLERDVQPGRAVAGLVDGLVDGLVRDVGVQQASAAPRSAPHRRRRPGSGSCCARPIRSASESWPARGVRRRPRSWRARRCAARSRSCAASRRRRARVSRGAVARPASSPARPRSRRSSSRDAVRRVWPRCRSPWICWTSSPSRLGDPARRRAQRLRVRLEVGYDGHRRGSRSAICAASSAARRPPLGREGCAAARAPRAAPRRASWPRERSRHRSRRRVRSSGPRRRASRTLASASSNPSVAVRRNSWSIASWSTPPSGWPGPWPRPTRRARRCAPTRPRVSSRAR